MKLESWHVQPDEGTEVHGLTDSIIHWCRESMASCRRPYGVDHFDLTIAFGSGGGIRNVNFHKLRIQHLYDEVLSRQLLEALGREVREARSTALHVAVGLFSWGDALDKALAGSEPATN